MPERLNYVSTFNASTEEAKMISSQNIDQLQVEAYRQMKGEERLRIGLGLYETSVEIARQSIQDRFPDASADQIEQKLRERIQIGYEIQSAAVSES